MRWAVALLLWLSCATDRLAALPAATVEGRQLQVLAADPVWVGVGKPESVERLRAMAAAAEAGIEAEVLNGVERWLR